MRKELPIKEISEMDKAWIAGFFDGEGCIQIRSSHYSSRVRPNLTLACEIDNTHKESLDRILKLLGFGTVRELYRNNKPKHHKKIYRYQTTGWGSLELLKILYPYLVTKKNQADVGMSFQKCGLPIGRYKKEHEDLHIFRYQCLLKLKGLKELCR